MKKLLSIIILVIGILSLSFIDSSAQRVKVQNEKDASMVVLETNVDSLSIVIGEAFSLPQYLSNNFTTYPIYYTKLIKSNSAKPRLNTTIEGSNDLANWAVVDTVGILADSIETYQSGSLNFNAKKFWYYRIKHIGATGNPKDVTSSMNLLFIKP